MNITGPILNLFLNKKAKLSLFSLLSIQLDAGLELETALAQAADTMKMRGAWAAYFAARYILKQTRERDRNAAFLEFANGTEALILADLGERDAGQVFRSAVRVMQSSMTISPTIRNNLAMPAVLVVATVGLMWMLHALLLPQVVEQQSTPSALITSTYALTSWVEAHIRWIGLGLVGYWIFMLVYGNWSSDPVRRGVFDRLSIGFRLNKIMVGCAFWITLIEKIKAGGEISTKTLSELAAHQSPYAGGCVKRISNKMSGKTPDLKRVSAFCHENQRPKWRADYAQTPLSQ